MATSMIVIEDSVTGGRYSVSLSNRSLSLVYLDDQTISPTGGLIIEDDATGEQYTFKLTSGELTLSPVAGSGGDILVTSNWPAVNGLRDGSDVCAATFNKPIRELAERTNYLYDKIRTFNRENPTASVILSDAKLDAVDTPEEGDVVYLDGVSDSFKKALAVPDLFDMTTSASSGYACGILIEKGRYKGRILLFGRIDFSSVGFDANAMLEEGETFREGIYYLSGKEPGKITSRTTNPLVVVGQFSGKMSGQNLVMTQAIVHFDTRTVPENHTHRAYRLASVPAGEQHIEYEGSAGRHVFDGYGPDYYASAPGGDDVFPRLVFTGEWLRSDDCKYRFILNGPVGDDSTIRSEELAFGQNPGVFLHCYNDTDGTSKIIEFTEFNHPEEVEYGLFVELRRSGLADSDNLVYRTLMDLDQKRTWDAGMTFPKAGMGWRDLTQEEVSRFQGRDVPAYVYNIGFDRALQTYYPPVPVSSAWMTRNGVCLVSSKFGKPYTFSVEQDSIYWYPDVYGGAPWPDSYFSRFTDASTYDPVDLILGIVSGVTAESGPVTSLRAREGSGIRVLRCGTNDRTDVGDIELDFDPTGEVEDDNLEGFKVVKGGSGGKFRTGPVVERVVAGSGIILSRYGSNPLGQGTVVISTSDSGMAGDFEEVALQNAKQDMVGMFPFVRLLGWSSEQSAVNIPSAFIVKFHIPYNESSDRFRVGVYASVFGTESYSDGSTRFAGVTFDYNILPDFIPVESSDGTYASFNVKDDMIAPDVSRSIDIPLVSEYEEYSSTYEAYDPILIHTSDGSQDIPGRRYSSFGLHIPLYDECGEYASRKSISDPDDICVRPGYTVAIRIARGPVTGEMRTEYTAPIGFMNMRWVLERIV